MASSVPTLISNAQTYAAGAISAADSALSTGVAQIQNIGWTALAFDGVALPTAPTLPEPLVAPALQEITVEEASEPDSTLIYQDISAIDAGSAPTFTATAPSISLPSSPSQLAEFQGSMPAVNTNLDFPEPPAELLNPLISAPVLVDRDEPEKPQTNLPAFTALAPTGLPDAPTDLRGTLESTYASATPQAMAMIDGQVDAWIEKYNPQFFAQMDALEDKLATYVQGGTGLAPAVETAIYERSRSKQDAEARRVRDAAWADTANRGFTLPTGALMAAARRTRQAAADNNAQAAREIVVMQAELEQKNVQFALTLSANVRSTMVQSSLNYHGNLVTINGQALEYAKSVAGILVEAYNVAARAFGLRLDAYRAEAAVYETQLKSALAGIELYRLEIDALKAVTDVDRAKVAIYEARISALTGLANTYRAQIEAVQGRVNLEKLKLDVFQAEVQAYTAEVQAKNGEWAAFKAAMDGEQAKVGLYEAQARVFGQQVLAYKATIDAKAEAVRAQAVTNQSRSENYKARWSAYQSLVQARGEVARTKLENQRQQVYSFQVESQAQIATAQMANDYYRATSEIGIKNAALSIEAIIKSAQNQREQGQTIASLYAANQKVHSELAAAAMAGMNTLAAESLAL